MGERSEFGADLDINELLNFLHAPLDHRLDRLLFVLLLRLLPLHNCMTDDDEIYSSFARRSCQLRCPSR